MKVFITSKTDKRVEAVLLRFCFKVAPKVFIAFNMSKKIEDYIFEYVSEQCATTGLIMLSQSRANQALVRMIGDIASTNDLDGIVVFK